MLVMISRIVQKKISLLLLIIPLLVSHRFLGSYEISVCIHIENGQVYMQEKKIRIMKLILVFFFQFTYFFNLSFKYYKWENACHLRLLCY